jgi:hypothetical protein
MAIITRKSSERGVSVLYWAVAALFNPIFPIHMDKSIWLIIDALVGWMFVACWLAAWPKKEIGEAKADS